jgi:hypothetical protein
LRERRSAHLCVYAAGGHIDSDGWSIRSIHPLPAQSSSDLVIEVGIRMSPQTVVQRTGASEQRFEGGRLPTTFHLKFSAGTWRVTQLERSA